MAKSDALARSFKPMMSGLSFSTTFHPKMDAKPSNFAPRDIILDFDGTITTKDTISVLANFGIKYQKCIGNNVTSAWNEIISKYSEDYSHHIENYVPQKQERENIAQEIAYLQSLRHVEAESFERVSKSKIFKGIANDVWRKAGRDMVKSGDVEVRKGFREFILDLQKQGGRCGVVSVNFSRHFIQGVLEASAGPATRGIEVLANLVDEEGIISGPAVEPDGTVMTTSDLKLACMRGLLSSWEDGQEKEFSERRKPVYVGDSVTDIECLLAEEVIGVIMSDQRRGNLTETLDRVHIHVQACKEYQEGKDHILNWASDFDDISNSSLFGIHPNIIQIEDD